MTLIFDVYTSGINCPVHVKVTDTETGLSGEATGRSRRRAHEAALENLQEKRAEGGVLETQRGERRRD